MKPAELRRGALEALRIDDPAAKCAAVAMLVAAEPYVDCAATLAEPAGVPGRPLRPLLVPPKDRDWLRVAAEEAEHFGLLRAHLSSLGVAYGDLPAHDGLWQMAERTRGDVLARMALVPRTLEARGLDASPLVRQKFVAAGDPVAAAIVDRILHDEIGHVAVGNRWFHALCRRRDIDPVAAYDDLTRRYQAPRLHGPFNFPARQQAGFLPDELAALAATAGR